MRNHATRDTDRRPLVPVAIVMVLVAASLLIVRAFPSWSPAVGLADGLAVGIVMGATRLVPDYDYAWDEFWQTTTLTYLLGIFALVVYAVRRETPSAFFWVECAAALIGYAMLAFVPPFVWLAADCMLFFGTFTGWLFSGLFRRDYF